MLKYGGSWTFEDKYGGDIVRIVKMGDYSKELCGVLMLIILLK